MKVFFFFLFFLCVQSFIAQEICDNGIDDDADGLIDLNDVNDCFCNTVAPSSSSLIPNPSFENHTICPTAGSQLNYANNWQQATFATSDYFNQCGYSVFGTIFPYTDDPSPYADGNACAGFYDGFCVFPLNSIYKEYIGTCVNTPLLAGVSYTLRVNIYTAIYNDGAEYCNSTDLDFSIFGTNNCSSFPIIGTTAYDCPSILSSDWFLISNQTVNHIAGSWQTITFTFTPSVNIEAIILGPGCNLVSNYDCPITNNWTYQNYYYIDNLQLDLSFPFTGIGINPAGTYCGHNIILSSTLSGSIASPTYQWYKDGVAIVGATSAVYTVPSGLVGVGFYQVRVSDGVNCAVSTPHQVIDASLTFSTTVEDVSCFGLGDGSIVITPTSGTAPYEYYIDNILVSSNIIDNLGPGNYSVLVQDVETCISTVNIQVLEPSPVQVQTNTYGCLPSGLTNLTANASGGTSPYTYLWDNTNITTNYSVNVIQDQVYTVQAIDANNCLSTTENVQIHYLPEIDFITDKAKVCPGNEVNFTLFVDGVDAMATNVNTVNWMFETGSSPNITNVKHTYNNTGTYTVSVDVSFINGCVATLEKIDLIKVNEAPQAQFAADPKETSVLNTNIRFNDQSVGANTYKWQTMGNVFGTSDNAEYTFDDQQGGTYEVCLEITSVDGCKDSHCLEIVIKDQFMIYIPNSFTPNGDDRNDVFNFTYHGLEILQFELLIYNRWGELVKKLEHQDEAWDGIINGKPAPLGVYSWTLAVKYVKHETILRKGSVTLVR